MAAIDNVYTMILRESNLTGAEIKAMIETTIVSEQRKSDAKAAQENEMEAKKPKDGRRKGNDLQRDSQEWEDRDDG